MITLSQLNRVLDAVLAGEDLDLTGIDNDGINYLIDLLNGLPKEDVPNVRMSTWRLMLRECVRKAISKNKSL